MNGILYLAYGERHIQQAIESAKSIKNQNDLYTAIVSDKKIKDTSIDYSIYKEIKRKEKNNRWEPCAHLDKIEALLKTPFENTLFLDSDTYCLTSIEDIFQILNRVDLGLTHDESRTLVEKRARGETLNNKDQSINNTIGIPQKILPDSLPESFAPINGGFYLYRSSPKIFEFWENVKQKYIYFNHHDEQAIVRLQLWEQTNINYHIFPKEYNFSSNKHYKLFKDGAKRPFQMAIPKIFHYCRNKDNYKKFVEQWEKDLEEEGYRKRNDMEPSKPQSRKVHIITIHWGDKWLDIQYKKIKKYNPDALIWAYIDNCDNSKIQKYKDKFHFAHSSGLKDHATKLDKLMTIVEQHSNPNDIICFLDADAFPLKNIKEYWETIEKSYPLAAVVREENGDTSPHPCFAITTKTFWKKNNLSWKHDDIGSEYIKNYHDVGGLLRKKLGSSKSKDKKWFPIKRNYKEKELHPLLFGIYEDIVYHHGAGSRPPCERCDRIDSKGNLLERNHPLVLQKIKKNQEISQIIYRQLLQGKDITQISENFSKRKKYPRTKEIQKKLVTAAREKIGTPWNHNQENKRGYDCARLLRASATEVGIKPLELKNYPRVPQGNQLFQELKRYGLEEIPKIIRKPGDILVFEFGGIPTHLGILSEKKDNIEYFIHASALRGENRVVEIELNSFYWRKLIAVYRITHNYSETP